MDLCWQSNVSAFEEKEWKCVSPAWLGSESKKFWGLVWISFFLLWMSLRRVVAVSVVTTTMLKSHGYRSTSLGTWTWRWTMEAWGALWTMGDVLQLRGVGRGRHQSLRRHCICQQAPIVEGEAATHARPRKVDGQANFKASQTRFSQEKAPDRLPTWLS